MKKNIGKGDRVLRLVAAIVFLLGSLGSSSWILFFISLFLFFQAAFSWCVLYQLFGKNSCPK